MTEETNFENKIVFKCTKCGWLYRDKNLAEECQKWCEKHKSCKLDLIKHAIKMVKQ